jgi:hypothetical protein
VVVGYASGLRDVAPASVMPCIFIHRIRRIMLCLLLWELPMNMVDFRAVQLIRLT